jgi:hypothetical protein
VKDEAEKGTSPSASASSEPESSFNVEDGEDELNGEDGWRARKARVL